MSMAAALCYPSSRERKRGKKFYCCPLLALETILYYVAFFRFVSLLNRELKSDASGLVDVASLIENLANQFYNNKVPCFPHFFYVTS